MRDLDRVNAKGVGKSRGYAFVNFLDHQHALQALRNTNNNPEIFSDKKVTVSKNFLFHILLTFSCVVWKVLLLDVSYT